MIDINSILNGIDRARLYALEDVAILVSYGYVPAVDEWDKLKEQINDLRVENAVPLVNTLMKRIKCTVSSGATPDGCLMPTENDSYETVLGMARDWWSSGDYDLARSAYHRLNGSPNQYAAIEANVACRLINDYESDFGSIPYLHTDAMHRVYRENCKRLCDLGGKQAIAVLIRMVQFAGMPIGLASHYTDVGKTLVTKNATKAKELIDAANQYQTLGMYIYQKTLDSFDKLLSTNAEWFDKRTIKHVIVVYESTPSVAKKKRHETQLNRMRECYRSMGES